MKYELVNYFDVWGNKEEGYEVNNMSNEGIITITNTSDAALIKALVDYEFFKSNITTEQVYVVNDGYMIEFYAVSDDRPLCRLQPKEDTDYNLGGNK